MPTAAKAERVDRLRAVITSNPTILAVGYRGLKVSDLEALRHALAGPGGKLRVVKNSLFRLAAAGSHAQELSAMLDGPSAIVYGGEGPAMAKALFEFARARPALALLGGAVEGSIVRKEGVEALSRVPPRQELLSMLVAGLEGPVSGLAHSLSGIIGRLAYALDEVKTLKEKAA